MKSLTTLVAVGILSAFIIGCEASAKVGDDDTKTSSYKKTTTYDNGDRKVTTERKTTVRED